MAQCPRSCHMWVWVSRPEAPDTPVKLQLEAGLNAGPRIEVGGEFLIYNLV